MDSSCPRPKRERRRDHADSTPFGLPGVRTRVVFGHHRQGRLPTSPFQAAVALPRPTFWRGRPLYACMPASSLLLRLQRLEGLALDDRTGSIPAGIAALHQALPRCHIELGPQVR